MTKTKLSLGDYLHMPVVELPQHDDFDETLFWAAMKISDMPMVELYELLKEKLNDSE